MSQVAHSQPTPTTVVPRHRSLVESLSEAKVSKLEYLLQYLMSGLSEEGSCRISKKEFQRAIGAKRFGKNAYAIVFEFMPKNKVKPEDVRILQVGGDVMLIDVNRLEAFSTVLTASEDN